MGKIVKCKAQLLPKQRQSRHNLQTALKTKETTQFFSVGHKLKGNAAIFGFQDLEDLGRRLETVETSKDWEIADSLLEELELWYLRQSKK